MRFEVPQFIEVEDKIVGPFTWKQFVYLFGGVGFATVLFFMTPFIIFILLGLPAAGLATLLAFYPVNNRPFEVFLESVATFYSSSTTYRWRKKEPTIYKEATHDTAPTTFTPPPINSRGINSLSRKLELKAIQKSQ
jgi:hypothetical protein